MKRLIYLLLSILLWILISFLIHATIEIPAIYFLTKDFNKYGLGLSWNSWYQIHQVGTAILLIFGVIFGYFIGKRWWRFIYIEKRYHGFLKKGFTMVELLVIMAIIGILASIILVSLAGARDKARDTKRKVELSQIGRFLSAGSCYLPNGGTGDYDLADLFDEIKVKYPQITQFISQAPRDPKSGTETKSYYHYIVNDTGKCALYANLEREDEAVTLPSISEPTPGGGTGVFQAASAGWNGSSKYYQISN